MTQSKSLVIVISTLLLLMGCQMTPQRAFVPHFDQAKESLKSVKEAKIELASTQTESLKRQFGSLIDLAQKNLSTAFDIRMIEASIKQGSQALTHELKIRMANEFLVSSEAIKDDDVAGAVNAAVAQLDSFVKLMRTVVQLQKDPNTPKAFYTIYGKEIVGRKNWQVDFLVKRYTKEGIGQARQLLKDYNLKKTRLPAILALEGYRKTVFLQLDSYNNASKEIAALDAEFSKENLDFLSNSLMLMEDRQQAVKLANQIGAAFNKVVGKVLKQDNESADAKENAEATLKEVNTESELPEDEK